MRLCERKKNIKCIEWLNLVKLIDNGVGENITYILEQTKKKNCNYSTNENDINFRVF